MATIIPFPSRELPSDTRYCAGCACTVVLHPTAEWPERCPACGSAPLVLTSWKPEMVFAASADRGFYFVGDLTSGGASSETDGVA